MTRDISIRGLFVPVAAGHRSTFAIICQCIVLGTVLDLIPGVRRDENEKVDLSKFGKWNSKMGITTYMHDSKQDPKATHDSDIDPGEDFADDVCLGLLCCVCNIVKVFDAVVLSGRVAARREACPSSA